MHDERGFVHKHGDIECVCVETEKVAHYSLTPQLK
jgi:hypothetical protein